MIRCRSRCCYHQEMRPLNLSSLALPLLATFTLAACNPTYNWREHTSQAGGYTVLFPAKPASLTRSVDLDRLRVDMTMTAAQVDGATFAVGSASAPDAARAQAAVPALRTALLRNIGADDDAAQDASQVDMQGRGADGQPIHLTGRFAARGVRVYQVIVVRKPGAVPPEQVEQFLTSFKPL